MPEIIHASGMREIVPTRKELERRILEQFGLDAIRAMLKNQRELAMAISGLKQKKPCNLEIGTHPIESACDEMDRTLALIAGRMERVDA